jgi:hypothetical protein
VFVRKVLTIGDEQLFHSRRRTVGLTQFTAFSGIIVANVRSSDQLRIKFGGLYKLVQFVRPICRRRVIYQWISRLNRCRRLQTSKRINFRVHIKSSDINVDVFQFPDDPDLRAKWIT